MEMDSETFYISVLEVLEDPEEQDEVKELLSWWNQYVVPLQHWNLAVDGFERQEDISLLFKHLSPCAH